jgi:hypothetical protein
MRRRSRCLSGKEKKNFDLMALTFIAQGSIKSGRTVSGVVIASNTIINRHVQALFYPNRS